MLTKDELKAKLVENADFELSDKASKKQKKLFEEAKAEISKEAEDKKKGKKKIKKSSKMSERFISKDDHINQMNELKSQLGIVEKKLRFKEVQATVDGYMFSESNRGGKLLPKSKEKAVEILMSANSKVAKLFEEFVSELPSISHKLFEEIGSGEGDNLSGADKVSKEASKLVEKGKASSYSEAVKILARTNPGLFENK
jgi:hypothetical protein